MKRKRTEEKIISAFCQQLLTKSIDQTRISQIVKAAGISQSSFYNYFQNKQDLVDSTLEFALDKLTQTLNTDLLYRKPTMIELLKVLQNEKEIYYPLATAFPNIDSIIENYVMTMLTHSEIENLYSRLSDAYEVPSKYAIEIYISTIIRIILKWVRSNFEDPVELVADIIYKSVAI